MDFGTFVWATFLHGSNCWTLRKNVSTTFPGIVGLWKQRIKTKTNWSYRNHSNLNRIKHKRQIINYEGRLNFSTRIQLAPFQAHSLPKLGVVGSNPFKGGSFTRRPAKLCVGLTPSGYLTSSAGDFKAVWAQCLLITLFVYNNTRLVMQPDLYLCQCSLILNSIKGKPNG